MRSGHTLLELASVLVVVGVALGAALPGWRTLTDRSAAISAREAVAGLIAEARAYALGRGDVRVEIDAESGRVWWEAPGASGRILHVRSDFAVELVLANGRGRSSLYYDALGIGRVASETILLRRGDAERGIVVSGFGRVRRR